MTHRMIRFLALSCFIISRVPRVSQNDVRRWLQALAGYWGHQGTTTGSGSPLALWQSSVKHRYMLQHLVLMQAKNSFLWSWMSPIRHSSQRINSPVTMWVTIFLAVMHLPNKNGRGVSRNVFTAAMQLWRVDTRSDESAGAQHWLGPPIRNKGVEMAEPLLNFISFGLLAQINTDWISRMKASGFQQAFLVCFLVYQWNQQKIRFTSSLRKGPVNATGCLTSQTYRSRAVKDVLVITSEKVVPNQWYFQIIRPYLTQCFRDRESIYFLATS